MNYRSGGDEQRLMTNEEWIRYNQERVKTMVSNGTLPVVTDCLWTVVESSDIPGSRVYVALVTVVRLVHEYVGGRVFLVQWSDRDGGVHTVERGVWALHEEREDFNMRYGVDRVVVVGTPQAWV